MILCDEERERRDNLAVEEHRREFIELYLAEGALRNGGSVEGAIALLQAAIDELRLPR